MPEPAARTTGTPPPLWPDTLPAPQAQSIAVTGPPRCEFSEVLKGPVRTRIVARTASQEFRFACFFTAQQMKEFEAWYRPITFTADGEFYARWIGGSRVVAFIEPYTYKALGAGYILQGHVIRTRIDLTACDAYINAHFGAIYRDDGKAPDIYQADLAATTIYKDDYDLNFIADHEC